MTIREQTQEIQARTLSKYASLSQNSLGRERPVEDWSAADPLRAGPRPDPPLQVV